MPKLSETQVAKYVKELDWYAQRFDKENFDKVNQILLDNNVQYENACSNEMLNRVLCMHIVDVARGLTYQCDYDLAENGVIHFTDLFNTWKDIIEDDMLATFNTFRLKFINQKLLLCDLAKAAQIREEPKYNKDINIEKITTYQKYVKSVDNVYNEEDKSAEAKKFRQALVDIYGNKEASQQKVKDLFRNNLLTTFQKELEKFLTNFMAAKLGSLPTPASLSEGSSRKLNADLSPEKTKAGSSSNLSTPTASQAKKNITAEGLASTRQNFEANSSKNDPLNDATKSKKRSLSGPKKSATSVEPIDDIEEDDEPVAMLPHKKRGKVESVEEFSAKLGDDNKSSFVFMEGVQSEDIKGKTEGKKRTRWSEEEELALRNGLDRYPPALVTGNTNNGNPVKYAGEIRYRWAEILKDDDFRVLRESGRDNIALKDKFKNWVKKGSINDGGVTERKKLKESAR